MFMMCMILLLVSSLLMIERVDCRIVRSEPFKDIDCHDQSTTTMKVMKNSSCCRRSLMRTLLASGPNRRGRGHWSKQQPLLPTCVCVFLFVCWNFVFKCELSIFCFSQKKEKKKKKKSDLQGVTSLLYLLSRVECKCFIALTKKRVNVYCLFFKSGMVTVIVKK